MKPKSINPFAIKQLLAAAALLPLLSASASAALVAFNTATDVSTKSLFQSNGTTAYTVAAATGEVNIGATPNVANGADNAAIWANIGSTITLANTNDAITLSGLVTLQSITTSTVGNFRFGLFNTNGSGTTNNWLGYSGSNDAQNAVVPNTGGMYERINGQYYSGTTVSTLDTYGTANANLTGGIQYSYEMTLTRNALGGLDYTTTMFQTGTPANILLNLSGTDATPQTFNFNRVGFLVGDSFDADRAEFRNVAVNFVPEPSAALLGGLGMLVLLRRRRA